MTSKKVSIIVGHEEKAQGAMGVAPINMHEYEWNKGLAALLACDLMDLNIESEIFFRDGVGILGAYTQSNKWGPLCSIELHFNAFNGQAIGSETLYNDGEEWSEKFAKIIQERMVFVFNRTGAHDRGANGITQFDRGYGNLSYAKCPAILIEPFFGDNVADAELAASKKIELSKQLAIGIASFIGSL